MDTRLLALIFCCVWMAFAIWLTARVIRYFERARDQRKWWPYDEDSSVFIYFRIAEAPPDDRVLEGKNIALKTAADLLGMDQVVLAEQARGVSSLFQSGYLLEVKYGHTDHQRKPAASDRRIVPARPAATSWRKNIRDRGSE